MMKSEGIYSIAIGQSRFWYGDMFLLSSTYARFSFLLQRYTPGLSDNCRLSLCRR